MAGLSHFLGERRRLIRRLGALCLVFIGVHQTADALDDLLLALLDVIDLAVDDACFTVLGALVDAGSLRPESAARAGEAFASLLALTEKSWLAVRLALAAELGVDVWLAVWVWGKRDDARAENWRAALRESAQRLRNTLADVDIERIAVPAALLLFSCAGAVVVGVAAEGALFEQLSRRAPFAGAPALAACMALTLAALFVARFAPDLIDGAMARSAVRAQDARQAPAPSPAARHPRWAAFRRSVALRLRGLGGLLLLVPLGVVGVVAVDVGAVVARASAAVEMVDVTGLGVTEGAP